MQELVEVVGRATGVVLMAPPVEHAEAAASISTLLSSLKPKQKVGSHFASCTLLALVLLLPAQAGAKGYQRSGSVLQDRDLVFASL